MAWPARDDPKYQERKDAYNARRRKRREDPEYVQRAKVRRAAQIARRKAKAKEDNK